jgi:hypothetical protein
MKAISLFRRILLLLLFPFLVIGSDLVISGEKDLIREITRPAEFDYVTWTIDSLALKVGHLSTNFVQFLEKNQQIQMVMDYLVSVENYNALSAKIGNIYANPTISNPTQAAASLLVEQKSLKIHPSTSSQQCSRSNRDFSSWSTSSTSPVPYHFNTQSPDRFTPQYHRRKVRYLPSARYPPGSNRSHRTIC